jgi:hypothetical protein
MVRAVSAESSRFLITGGGERPTDRLRSRPSNTLLRNGLESTRLSFPAVDISMVDDQEIPEDALCDLSWAPDQIEAARDGLRPVVTGTGDCQAATYSNPSRSWTTPRTRWREQKGVVAAQAVEAFGPT